MATLQIGAKDPLNINDSILESYRQRVQGGEDANNVALDFFNSARGEIEATLNPQMGRYDASVLSKYGLTDSTYSHVAGSRTLQDTPVLALGSFLKGAPQPTQYDPATKQIVAGTDTNISYTPGPSSKQSSPSAPITPGKYIITGDGREVNYDFADTTLRAQADAGQLKTRQDAGYQSRTNQAAITPESIQAGITALNERIAREGITDGNGQVMMPPTKSNSQGILPGTINSDALKNSNTNFTLPNFNSDTSRADATVAGSEASNKSLESYIKLLTPTDSATSQTVKTLTDTINKELEALKGRGATQLSEEAKQGVEVKKQALQNFQTELQVKTAEYKAIQAKYQALNAEVEGKAVTMNSIIGSQSQVNRVMQAELNGKAAEIAMIQANVAGAQGNLSLAQDSANRAVDLKYSDAKDAVDVRLKQLEVLEGQLSKEEEVRKNALTLYLQEQRDRLAVTTASEKDRNATLLNQMQKYPDAGITLQDNIESANQKITQKSQIYQKEKTASATQGIEDRSGSLVYTAQDAAEDSFALEKSRGGDGYVDPSIFLNLYQAWVSGGGLLKDFLLKYPPKNYVNPANTWLPPFLKPNSDDNASLF